MREYTGSTLGGTRHGSGKCTFRNKGFAYDGEWKDGLMEGRGTLTLAGVFSYTGDFRRNQISGMGVKRLLATGAVYEGSFVDGEPHGTAVYTDADVRYDGDFVRGRRHGFGVLQTSAGRFEGTFANHALCEGTMQYASGSRYVGSFTGGVRSGKGRMEWPNGGAFEGEWEEDQPKMGRFEQVAASPAAGYVYEGKFVDGAPPVEPLPTVAIAIGDDEGDEDVAADITGSTLPELRATVKGRRTDKAVFHYNGRLIEALPLRFWRGGGAPSESGRELELVLSTAAPSSSGEHAEAVEAPTVAKTKRSTKATVAASEPEEEPAPPREFSLATIIMSAEGRSSVQLRLPTDAPSGKCSLLLRDVTDAGALAACSGRTERVARFAEQRLTLVIMHEELPEAPGPDVSDVHEPPEPGGR